jgi:hypothetical protein
MELLPHVPRSFVLPLLLALGAGLLAGCGDAAGPGDGAGPVAGRRFVAVAGDQTLRLLDAEAGDWEPGVWGLGLASNWIVPAADRLYVVNSVSNDLSRFRLEESLSLEALAPLDLGRERNRNPWAAARGGDGRLLVSNLLENTVSLVDPAAGRVDAVWAAGLAPEGVGVRDSLAWVVNSGYDFATFSFGPGSLYLYDYPEGELRDSVALPVNAQFGALDGEGRLHVVCTGDYGEVGGEVVVLELPSLAQAGRLELEGYPGRIAITPAGVACLAAGGWSGEEGSTGLVLRYDAASLDPLPPLHPSLGVVDVAAGPGSTLWTLSREAGELARWEGEVRTGAWSLEDPPNALAVWVPPATP